MQVISDAISFLKTLTFVDIVFFLAVLSLMLLVITLIYFIRENSDEIDKKDDNTTKNDDEGVNELIKIASEIEQRETNSDLNVYEEEQEEKAIISYEELLKRKNDFAINYSEEENISDDLTVKKVDLNNLLNKDIVEHEHQEIKVSVISYEKEEAFLEALKKLQQKLN